MGVYPRVKHVYICGDHFDRCCFFGDRLTKFAKPNPPASRNRNIINNDLNARTSETAKDTNEVYNPVNELPIELNEEQDIIEETVTNDEEPVSWNNLNNQSFQTNNIGKIEDFEIRKDTTKDTIIKGRYIQTNDYLVVSYTPPRKWTLQQQVKLLDAHCKSQLKQINNLTRELARARNEMKLYDKLLPKLRYFQTKNRCLMAAVNVYKRRETQLKKKLRRERKLKLKANDGEEVDFVEILNTISEF